MAQAEHAKQRRDMIMKQSQQSQQIDSLQLQLNDTQHVSTYSEVCKEEKQSLHFTQKVRDER